LRLIKTDLRDPDKDNLRNTMLHYQALASTSPCCVAALAWQVLNSVDP